MPNSDQNKVSPRKFSEKIALLVKKEAEGNAEFEEIIKEVQATRSQTSTQRNSAVFRRQEIKKDGNPTSSDELEEVYENLIKCIVEYEDEIRVSQDRILSSSTENACDSTTSAAGKAYSAQTGTSSLPLPIDRPSRSVTTENCELVNSSKVQTVETSDSQPTLASALYRPRVTSVGSVYQRQIHPYYNDSGQPCQSIATTPFKETHLKPNSCDKNWQKSCSDPTLNSAMVCLSNLSSVAGGGSLLINSSSAHSSMLNSGKISEQVQNAPKPDIRVSIDQQYFQDSEMHMSGYEYSAASETRMISAHSDAIDADQDFQLTSFASISHKADATLASHQPTEPLVKLCQNSSPTLVSLPGIKICSISDESVRSKLEGNDLNDARTSSRNSSLLNLQCCTTDEVQHGQSEPRPIFYPEVKGDRLIHNASMTVSNSISRSSASRHSNSNIRSTSSCSTNHYPNEVNSYSSEGNIHAPSTQMCMITMAEMKKLNHRSQVEYLNDRFIGITNSTFGSEHAILHPELKDSIVYHNIMRSHSHGGIDYLTKHGLNIKLTDDCASDQHCSRFGHDPHDHRRADCCSSIDSIVPMYGSFSPMHSTSNLTSPVNSPGESINDNENLIMHPRATLNSMTDGDQVGLPSENYSILCGSGGDGHLGASEETPDCMHVTASSGSHVSSAQSHQGHENLDDFSTKFRKSIETFIPLSNTLVESSSTMKDRPTSIGPYQSPFRSRRKLHNQLCQSTYLSSPFKNQTHKN